MNVHPESLYDVRCLHCGRLGQNFLTHDTDGSAYVCKCGGVIKHICDHVYDKYIYTGGVEQCVLCGERKVQQ